MKNLIFLLFAVLFASISFGQSVVVKDNSNDTLIAINDEGINKSSLTIQNSASAPGILTDKLYNVGHSLFWNGSLLGTGGSSVWSLNGSNAYYNAGNVGIGTSIPRTKLHLLGDFTMDDASPTIAFYSGTTQMGSIGFWTDNNLNIINRGATSPIVFATNAAEKMRITADGKVGIGTITPFATLSVGGSGLVGSAISGKTIDDYGAGIYGEATGSFAIGVLGKATNTTENSHYGGFFEAAGINGIGVYGKAIDGWAGYFIGKSYFNGYVSIGTATPTRPLTIYDPNVSYAAFQYSGSGNTAHDGIIVGAEPSGGYLWNFEDTPLTFATNNEARMIIATDGNVGIGVVQPETDLHIDGTEGLLVHGTQNSGTALNLGAGTRMHFYPKKSAFRVGNVYGNYWDDINIGSGSVAMGLDTKASGSGGSFAMGIATIADGTSSFAVGNSTRASGVTAVATGISTKASGNYSTAMGFGIEASGAHSFAIGLNDQIGTNVTQPNTMAIMGGDVGIGESDPEAKLDVAGDVILGTNGTRFLDIREVSGITGTGGGTTYYNSSAGYPTGWSGTNTHILSLRIFDGSRWWVLGSEELGTDISVAFSDSGLWIYHPNDPLFQGKPWRMIIMVMP